VRPAPELSEDGLLASACGRHGRHYRATQGWHRREAALFWLRAKWTGARDASSNV